MARFPFQIMAVTLAFVSVCAPGKGPAGGMGCSKTSSVLKTPKIVATNSETMFDPNAVVNPDDQRRLFYKHFGQFKAKSTGGYLYIQSRPANDPMGQVPEFDSWHRCSVFVEFPKRTGEIRAPSVSGSPWYGKSTAEVEADRFPGRSDALKVRLYTAAHCLDYSLDDRLVLSLFTVAGQELPEFDKAYVNLEVKVPELEAVKTLRTALKERVGTAAITSTEAAEILKAFQPGVRDMNKVFDVPVGSIVSSPSPKQNCMIPPKASDGDTAKQYTCATYHDMAVLDVELANLSAAKDSLLRDVREKTINNLRNQEDQNPDIAGQTGAVARSPWKEYAENEGFRMFIGDVLHHEQTEFAPTTYTMTTDLSGYPKYYKIKFSCQGVAAPECDEPFIDSLQNLHYMRYMTRERLRSFSRYNMIL
ncbi:hypothetical protein EBU99_14550 [bacterium]|nr:hypothetical protein [bacterium]